MAIPLSVGEVLLVDGYIKSNRSTQMRGAIYFIYIFNHKDLFSSASEAIVGKKRYQLYGEA